MVEREDSLYVFISIDLVNSSAYKHKYPKKWPKVFRDFYILSTEHLSRYFVHSKLKVWKRLGDEILFYIAIKNRTEMYKLLEYVDNTLITIQERLSEDDPIQAKASLWAADIIVYNECIKNYNNVALFTKNPEEMPDFIGNDMDTGFRIAKHVMKGRIVVCAKLAYTLSKMKSPDEHENNISEYLRIVSYEKLRGIWSERPYPIIWYCKDWKNIAFDYDEHIDSKIIFNIKYEKIDHINRLDKILIDLGKKEEYDELHNLFIATLDKAERHDKYKSMLYKLDTSL